MKLVIEIKDWAPCKEESSEKYWCTSSIKTDDNRLLDRRNPFDFIDKQNFNQAERLARLIALSKEIDKTVEKFYSGNFNRFKIVENSE